MSLQSDLADDEGVSRDSSRGRSAIQHQRIHFHPRQIEEVSVALLSQWLYPPARDGFDFVAAEESSEATEDRSYLCQRSINLLFSHSRERIKHFRTTGNCGVQVWNAGSGMLIDSSQGILPLDL
ncbi:hypothetical protein MRB53_039978 [Persea americana]|nr:hypothetical protein MRB53_039978 [Persea americana]